MAPPGSTARLHNRMVALLRKASQVQLRDAVVHVEGDQVLVEDKKSDPNEDGLSKEENIELMGLVTNAQTSHVLEALASVENVSVLSPSDKKERNEEDKYP